MATVSLQKVFAGSVTYVADHEANYTAIENMLNALYDATIGATSLANYDPRVDELYDRRGIFGKASYKPVAATLTGPNYNLTVAVGGYWSAVEYRNSLIAVTLSLLAFSTGTLYISVPTGGVPTVATSATADTVWQFAWDASTHIASSVALYSSCNILFDGDDYNEAITGYQSLDERLDAIELAMPKKTILTSAGHAVGVGATQTFNITTFINRGLVYKLKITETGGTMTGTYDVIVYGKDTFLAADIAYQATAVDATLSSRVYQDSLPWFYRDDDLTSELHIKIINNDGVHAGAFTFELTTEQFA